MLPSEAKDLISEIADGGANAARAFGELVHSILAATILHDHEKLRCVFDKDVNLWVLKSQNLGRAVQLRDKRFLFLRYELDLKDGKKLSVVKSTIQYQENAEKPLGEIFRYEYERKPPVQGLYDHSSSYEERIKRVPESHLHICARTGDTKIPPGGTTIPLHKATWERQHFPCGRVSLETIIRMLVRDFMIVPKTSTVGWLDLLDKTETAFHNRYDPNLVRV